MKKKKVRYYWVTKGDRFAFSSEKNAKEHEKFCATAGITKMTYEEIRKSGNIYILPSERHINQYS